MVFPVWALFISGPHQIPPAYDGDVPSSCPDPPRVLQLHSRSSCLPNSSSLPASPHPTHPLLPDTAPRGSGWGVPASACLAESQGNSWLCTTPRQATVDRTGTPRSELTSSCHLPQCDQVVNCVHTNLCHWNGSPRWLTLMNLLIFCSDM